MALRTNLKSQLGNLSNTVHQAEKAATKQIRQIMKSTERIRAKQLKHVHSLIKKAEMLRSSGLAKQAEKVKDEIESRATAGFEILMSKLNLPSKKEIERLTKKVSALQKKIEDLEKTRSTN